MKLARRILGVVCIILGVLALITPLTPGSWLIFVGAEILGIELVFAKRAVAYLNGFAGRLTVLGLILAPFLAGAIGAYFTMPNIATWYAFLTRPWWTPPAYVFGPVWTALYALMAVAIYLAWRSGGAERRLIASVFVAQLVLNALWSIVFFGMHSPAMALAVIAMLWLSIAWLIMLVAPRARTAAWLLVPYLLWVSYAATLNLGIVVLN
ncbi:MAG: tryptophan-rich sensory protein [Alphaproteobacteria bacterium]|nr:tryptophan-rich sensory protein [Alphaproteobacteria bacterium]